MKAAMIENQEFHSCLIPSPIPIQIWPEPTMQAKKQKQITVSFQKFYKFIVIFAITTALVLNSHFVITKLITQNSISKNTSVSAPAIFLNKVFQPVINSNISNDIPVRLLIPNINVDANIQQVGLTPEGILDVPIDAVDVGWYKLGPRPGQKGSAVIDGHVDGPDGLPAIFSQLHALKEGDKIIVENDKNKQIHFVVKKVSRYAADDYVSDVFSNNAGINLNLITCNGIWDASKKTYTERLVVFAEAVQI